MAKIAFFYAAHENLGIEYLSVMLKQAGHQTRLFFDPILFDDPCGVDYPFLGRLFSRKEKIMGELARFGPDLVCFSAISDHFRWAVETADRVKRNYPHIPIIFGGIHPTCAPEETIRQPAIDFCCVGEGERAIVEVAALLDQGKEIAEVANVWSKRGGEIIRAPMRPLISNLDDLPFPDKGLYYEQFASAFVGYTLATSRGCVHACAFCANSCLRELYRSAGAYIRRRSVENVLRELELAKRKYQPRYVRFVDEIFTFDRAWLEKFLPLYQRRIGLPFSCNIHPRFAEARTADLLAEAGCYLVRMGVQTINEKKRRDILNRHHSNEQVAAAIRNFKARSIYITCDNMLGLPGQDEEDLIASARFYLDNPPDRLNKFWLRYYPGTKIKAKASEMGVAVADADNPLGCCCGGDTYDPLTGRFHLCLTLLDVLPASWVRAIVDKKLYRRFPLVTPYLANVFSIGLWILLFRGPKFDIEPARTWRRYLLFSLEKLGWSLSRRPSPASRGLA